MPGKPYAPEELLTFDRLRRAVTRKVVDAAEELAQRGTVLDRSRLIEMAGAEWKAAKDAVRASPAAKEVARERMRSIVHAMLDDVVGSEQRKGKQPWE